MLFKETMHFLQTKPHTSLYCAQRHIVPFRDFYMSQATKAVRRLRQREK
jgi:hypothetical protein